MGYLNQQQTYNMPNYGKPNNNSLTDVGAILNAIGQIIGVYQEIRSNGNQPTYTQQQPVYYYPSNYLLAY